MLCTVLVPSLSLLWMLVARMKLTLLTMETVCLVGGCYGNDGIPGLSLSGYGQSMSMKEDIEEI